MRAVIIIASIAYFCVCKSKKTLQDTKVTNFNIYPNFWEWVLIKNQISKI